MKENQVGRKPTQAKGHILVDSENAKWRVVKVRHTQREAQKVAHDLTTSEVGKKIDHDGTYPDGGPYLDLVKSH
jgi:hypothetical protein